MKIVKTYNRANQRFTVTLENDRGSKLEIYSGRSAVAAHDKAYQAQEIVNHSALEACPVENEVKE